MQFHIVRPHIPRFADRHGGCCTNSADKLAEAHAAATAIVRLKMCCTEPGWAIPRRWTAFAAWRFVRGIEERDAPTADSNAKAEHERATSAELDGKSH
jgi:hypothetical protein